MKIFENKRTNYQISALLIYLRNILFPIQLQENYETPSINKIIMYKRKNRNVLIVVQRDATQSSLFIILQVHSTCFGC